MTGILGSTTLEVVIGIMFVYLLLAIICTTLNEWLAGLLKARSKNLKTAIEQLLDDQPGQGIAATDWFMKEFYAHPLVQGMTSPKKGGKASFPSYLPGRTFRTAVLDIATAGQRGPMSIESLEAGVKQLPDGDVKKALEALWRAADGDVEKFKKDIEGWFDDTMDRVSGWYKRKTQVSTVILAILLTALSNADTLRIGKILWNNPTVRAQAVEQAKGRVESNETKDLVEYKDNDALKPTARISQAESETLDQLIGWKPGDWQLNGAWWPRLFGWFLTIVAISLGAPFWFDLLNKFMNVRNAGRPPSESAKAPQKPRQPPQDKLA
jgi:hypothetical protein